MAPLLLTNLTLLAFALLCFQKKLPDADAKSLLKHIGLLELAWIGFLFLLGLFLLFDMMEAKQDGISLLEMADREMVMLFSILCGFGIVHFSILVAIVIKVLKKRSA